MLYFDESGYTGSNLVDRNRPYFTLASVCLSTEEEEQIKSDIRYSEWRNELHFVSMVRHPQGWPLLNKLYHHPILNKKHVKLAYAEKRYCIYAQIVDTLIETFLHNIEDNIYVGAENLLMANCLYYEAIAHQQQNLITEFEQNFVGMFRNPTVNSVADFYRITDKLIFDADTGESFKDLLSLISRTIVCIEEALNKCHFCLDLTVPLFSESIQDWYRDTHIKHDVIFDHSKPFLENMKMLEALRDMKISETMVGYGDRKHVYPLPVGRMELEDSKLFFGIQLADVYASALNFILANKSDKDLKRRDVLKNLLIFQKVDISIAPSSPEFIRKRMKDVEGIDPLNFICKNITL